jgi:hypothetical protein
LRGEGASDVGVRRAFCLHPANQSGLSAKTMGSRIRFGSARNLGRISRRRPDEFADVLQPLRDATEVEVDDVGNSGLVHPGQHEVDDVPVDGAELTSDLFHSAASVELSVEGLHGVVRVDHRVAEHSWVHRVGLSGDTDGLGTRFPSVLAPKPVDHLAADSVSRVSAEGTVFGVVPASGGEESDGAVADQVVHVGVGA